MRSRGRSPVDLAAGVRAVASTHATSPSVRSEVSTARHRLRLLTRTALRRWQGGVRCFWKLCHRLACRSIRPDCGDARIAALQSTSSQLLDAKAALLNSSAAAKHQPATRVKPDDTDDETRTPSQQKPSRKLTSWASAELGSTRLLSRKVCRIASCAARRGANGQRLRGVHPHLPPADVDSPVQKAVWAAPLNGSSADATRRPARLRCAGIANRGESRSLEAARLIGRRSQRVQKFTHQTEGGRTLPTSALWRSKGYPALRTRVITRNRAASSAAADPTTTSQSMNN